MHVTVIINEQNICTKLCKNVWICTGLYSL